MSTSRRRFLQLSALAGGAAALGAGRVAVAGAPVVPRASRSLRILVLGGTGISGPYFVERALARGHDVTLFNRGTTNPGLFAEVEKLVGDRAGDLSALAAAIATGRRWDAVVDNSASIPAWVVRSTALLEDAADLYLFTSSGSAYADHSVVGLDEDAPLATMSDQEAAEVTRPEQIGANFGALKARCEAAARAAFPGRAIVVRPGLISGPGDSSDRFSYWPVRIHRGGEILAPGHPTDPVQLIDARDLAAFDLKLVEDRAVGVYNATGPASPLSIAELLYGIRATTAAELSFTWVPAEFLAEHGVEPWQHMTVWVPPVGEHAGFSTVSVARAKRAGLAWRPLAETAADTVTWWKQRDPALTASPRAGLAADREREVLAAWRARGGKRGG